MDEWKEEHTEVLARIVWARKRPSLLWLVGTGICFISAVAITVFAPPPTRVVERATTAVLESQAADIGRAVDSVARAAHVQANTVAATSMIRAAILTDAATVADVMKTEFKLELRPDEVIELFQIHGNQLTTLIRIPGTAAALPAVKDKDVAIVHVDQNGLYVVVGAPVERIKDGAGYDTDKTGMFVLAAPVDLEPMRKQLAEYVVDATLAESGKTVRLVHKSPPVTAELVRLTVPSKTAELTLVVAPVMTSYRATWIDPARYASFALGGLLLVVFALMLALRRPTPRRY
jgi:hypothetical protein